jgi:hypothetical protein
MYYYKEQIKIFAGEYMLKGRLVNGGGTALVKGS